MNYFEMKEDYGFHHQDAFLQLPYCGLNSLRVKVVLKQWRLVLDNSGDEPPPQEMDMNAGNTGNPPPYAWETGGLLTLGG